MMEVVPKVFPKEKADYVILIHLVKSCSVWEAEYVTISSSYFGDVPEEFQQDF